MNRFTLEIEKGRFREYEIVSLSHDVPEYLIPMSFIDYKDVYEVTYDYSGYKSLGDYDGCFGVRDILDCIEGIVSIFRKAHMNLLFPDRFTLRKETVYYNKGNRSVKLVFLPPDNDTKPSEELATLIKEIQEMYISKEAAEYLEMIKTSVKQNTGLREIQSRITMIKREALICGID
ncbi:MAG: hypothetical protein IJP24_05375 [Firmicutes bacterium]|nr:hypothetical protein [Bacillota bacterium]